MRCQDLMEIVFVGHISHVGGQGMKIIDDECLRRSPHCFITDNVAGVINHGGLLFFKQGGRRVPSQGL